MSGVGDGERSVEHRLTVYFLKLHTSFVLTLHASCLDGLRSLAAVQGLNLRDRGRSKFDTHSCRRPPLHPCLISRSNTAMGEIQREYVRKIRSFFQRQLSAGFGQILHQAPQAISSAEPDGPTYEYWYAFGIPTFPHATPR